MAIHRLHELGANKIQNVTFPIISEFTLYCMYEYIKLVKPSTDGNFIDLCQI